MPRNQDSSFWGFRGRSRGMLGGSVLSPVTPGDAAGMQITPSTPGGVMIEQLWVQCSPIDSGLFRNMEVVLRLGSPLAITVVSTSTPQHFDASHPLLAVAQVGTKTGRLGSDLSLPRLMLPFWLVAGNPNSTPTVPFNLPIRVPSGKSLWLELQHPDTFEDRLILAMICRDLYTAAYEDLP